MNKEILELATKMLFKNAKIRLESGKHKEFIGVAGNLALMLDKIERFFATKNQDELLDLATDALFIMCHVVKHVETEEEDEDIEDDTEPSVEDKAKENTEEAGEVKEDFDEESPSIPAKN